MLFKKATKDNINYIKSWVQLRTTNIINISEIITVRLPNLSDRMPEKTEQPVPKINLFLKKKKYFFNK
jgi:hypothetical protein